MAPTCFSRALAKFVFSNSIASSYVYSTITDAFDYAGKSAREAITDHMKIAQYYVGDMSKKPIAPEFRAFQTYAERDKIWLQNRLASRG